MAFFDNFGEKVTQVSQDAVAKAKNLTDQVKLSSQINEEEKKISEKYRKIGELFYGVRGEQELPEYQTLMEEIDTAKEKLAELKLRLQVAKGLVVCPACGAEVSTSASFCPNCGEKMPQPEPEEASEEESADAAEPSDETEKAEEDETAEEAVDEVPEQTEADTKEAEA